MLNHRSLLFGLMLIVGLVPLTGEASAYQVQRAPWSELVSVAERAIHGHVSHAWCEWAPDGSGKVITRYEVLVWDERQVSGPASVGRVVVTLPGGRVGDRRTVVPGLKPFQVGDELLLLLTYTPWGWQPIGYEMGVLRLNDRHPSQMPDLNDVLHGTLGQARVAP